MHENFIYTSNKLNTKNSTTLVYVFCCLDSIFGVYEVMNHLDNSFLSHCRILYD
jgi:hypothetical protein